MAAGNLTAVDFRPVNYDSARRDTIRWGFDFSKPLKSARAVRRRRSTSCAALRAQAAAGAAAAGGGAPPPRAEGGHRRRAGRRRPRSAAAVAASAAAVAAAVAGVRRRPARAADLFADRHHQPGRRAVIRPGLPELDYLRRDGGRALRRTAAAPGPGRRPASRTMALARACRPIGAAARASRAAPTATSISRRWRRSTCACSPISARASTWWPSTRGCAARRCGWTSTTCSTRSRAVRDAIGDGAAQLPAGPARPDRAGRSAITLPQAVPPAALRPAGCRQRAAARRARRLARRFARSSASTITLRAASRLAPFADPHPFLGLEILVVGEEVLDLLQHDCRQVGAFRGRRHNKGWS